MFFTKTPVLENPQLRLEALLYLINKNKLPVTSDMLEEFCNGEDLARDSTPNLTDAGYLALNSSDGQWCLEKIVWMLIKKYRIIDINLYKKLVNVVNELGLTFGFLDKTIKRTKQELNK